MSDEDLIFLINAGSMLAEQVMYERYSKYSHLIAHGYHNDFKSSGITEEEFFAVAFAKTPQAIQNYSDKDIPFHSYWLATVKNAIYDYVNTNSYRLGARPLSGISFDEEPYNDNEHLLFHDIFGEEDNHSGTAFDLLDQLLSEDDRRLDSEQKLVARLLFVEELKPAEAIEITGFTRSRFSYLTRVTKRKIQQIMKENYLK